MPSVLLQEPKNLSDRLTPVLGFLQAIQVVVSVGLGLGTLALLCGFEGVNVFLGKFTDVTLFNVAPAHYFALGYVVLSNAFIVGALFFMLGVFAWPLGVFKIFLWLDRRTRWFDQLIRIDKPVIITRKLHERLTLTLYTITSVIVFVLVLLMYTDYYVYNFVETLYNPITGGGRPSTVILSIKPDYPLSSLLLSSDPTYPNNTTTVLLLAELNDGFLVADQSTGRVLAIGKDVIAAIIDDEVSPLLIVPTATPTLTPVPTMTTTP